MRPTRHRLTALTSPATPLGALLVVLAHHRHRASATADRGASLVEWVIITAAVIGLAAVVVGVIVPRVTQSANQIQMP
ncbi:MAG: hypothetical protein ACFCVG_08685 [Kineosporiaceae bacterium]